MSVALDVALFAAAWLGHAFALTVVMNLVFARALPRPVLKLVRAAIFVLVVPLPPVLWWLDGFEVGDWFLRPAESWGGMILRAWLPICWVEGVVVLPLFTLLRMSRRPPAALLRETGEVADVATELGSPPRGRGKHPWMTRLPLNCAFEVEFTELELRLPGLPAAWDGLTILHLSDLHYHGTPGKEYHRWVIDRLLERPPPDLVCLTGDYVDTWTHHRWVVPLLGRVRGSAPGFAVLGNHDVLYDAAAVRRQLRKSGYELVGGGWTRIELRGEPLVILGHEGPWLPTPHTLADVPAGPWRLGLAHSPDGWPWMKRHGAGLVLAGHVHGGGIRLPAVGPLFVPSRFSRRYDGGVYAEGGSVMVVGRGLGGREPLRINCRPEVGRVVLRPG